ncbi:MAG TPA: VOC family protein [Chloroflexia bacterium]|nr:VOC family protein [Chloroflexia bacterium]
MHRSKLTAILIDCDQETAETGVNFWSQALGMEAKRSNNPDSPYTSLSGGGVGLDMMVQRVDAPSRFHLDLETDNLEAEVKRLEKLGATRVEQVEQWWIMRAPTGHLFCVVPTKPESLGDDANSWED